MNCPCIFLLFWSFVGAVGLSRAQSRDKPPLQMSLQMPGQPQQPQAGSALIEDETTIIQPVLKDIPPRLFIFKSGAGPYTYLKKEFGELSDFMEKNNLPGVLAAVFYDDPAKVVAESLRWEVGIITNQQLSNSEPYSQKIISGHKAATLMASGAPGHNRELYPKLFGFIRQKRMLSRYPIMEVYTRLGALPESSKVEIQAPAIQKRRN